MSNYSFLYRSSDYITCSSLDDSITTLAFNWVIPVTVDGLSGVDTVFFDKTKDNYTITTNLDGSTLVEAVITYSYNMGVGSPVVFHQYVNDTLINCEILRFSNGQGGFEYVNIPGLGNNSIVGTAGNDLLAGDSSSIDGGAGLDTVTYSGARASYTVAQTSTGYTVSGFNLANIERLHFTDVNLALDMNGNAGTTAKILGAVFGATSLSNKTYVGIGLSNLDGGMSYADLMAVALNAAGATTSNAIVTLLWTNLFGVAPTSAEEALYIAMIDSGSYSSATLGVLAADTSFNATNINLVGLAQTGIEFA